MALSRNRLTGCFGILLILLAGIMPLFAMPAMPDVLEFHEIAVHSEQPDAPQACGSCDVVICNAVVGVFAATPLLGSKPCRSRRLLPVRELFEGVLPARDPPVPIV